MKKSQIYRTALDAIEFLLTADEIRLSEEEFMSLDCLYFEVTEQMKDDLHNVVSLKNAKEVK